MKQFIVRNKKAISAGAVCLLIAGVTLSFQDTPYVNQILNEQKALNDTFPSKKHVDKMTMKEFDQFSKELDETMLKVGEELNNLNIDNILGEVELSIKSIDMDNIMKDVEQSLKEIDVEKINAEVMASVKDIDWENAGAEVQHALKEAAKEMEKAKLELKKINTDEIKKEMNNAKKEIGNRRMELENTKRELKKIDPAKIMKEANEGIKNAKTELKELKTMFSEMESDGLVDSKKGFRIEYKDKDLFINGVKQQQPVTDKYKKYFKEDHFEIEIEKEMQ